jgi:hypothetical protein
MRYGSIVFVVALAACKGGSSDVETDTDDVHIDTGVVVDTDETDVPDETDTDTGSLLQWTEISLSPASLTVSPGATLTYRLVATSPDGDRGTPEGVTWTSSDPGSVEVIDGVATAVAEGVVTITASWEGGEAEAELVVQSGGTLEVTVVDALSGDPIPAARVRVDEAYDLPDTDAAGFTTIGGIPGEAVTICAWESGWRPACAGGVVGRRIVLPLNALDGESDPGELSGTCDASAVPTDASKLVVGIVVPGLEGSPWWATLDDLLGPNRTVTVYGVDANLPSNVTVQGYADDWSVDAEAGARDVWAVAAAIPVSEALAAASGTRDPLSLLGEHAGNGLWTSSSGLAVTSGAVTDAGAVAPVTPFTSTVEVLTGELPAGTAGDEVALVLPIEERPGGWVAGGIGTGLTSVTSVLVADVTPTHALAFVQAGGFGSGGGESIAAAPVYDGVAELPPFTDIPSLPQLWPATDSLVLSTDPDGTLVQLRGIDREFHERDVYGPGGAVTIGLPEIPPPFDRGRTEWNVRSIVTREHHYEALLSTGSLTLDALGLAVTGTSTVSGDVAASAFAP